MEMPVRQMTRLMNLLIQTPLTRTTPDQYRAAADQAHAAYITTLTASLTTRYKPCMDTITEWTDGLTKVKGMMPPQSPQTPPLIDVSLSAHV